MAIKPLNSVAGFSVGETPTSIVLANGDITTTNITTTGVANLNAIGNVKIFGGSSGQYIQTDGLGTLSFATINTTALSNGNSNVQVLENANITFSSAGIANIVVITGTGEVINGTLSVTGNSNVGNIGVSGFVSATGNVTGSQLISTVFTGTAPLSVSSTTLVPNLYASRSQLSDTLAVQGVNSGNYYVGLYAAGSGNLQGSSNTAFIANTSNGAFYATTFVGNVNSTGNSNVGNLGVTSALTTGSLSVSGTSNLGPISNVTITGGSANYLLQTNGSGVLTWVAPPSTSSIVNGNSNVSIPNANGNVNISAVGNANVVIVTGTGANINGYLSVSGNANIGNIGIGGVITATGTITGGNLATAGTLSAGGNANVGNLGTIGLITATGNIQTSAFLVGANLSVTGNANVGNIGGTNGVFTANVSANNITTTNKITAGNGLSVTSGTLTVSNGNLDVTGNINVTGNLNYSNVTDLVVGDPLIYIGANNTGDLYDEGIVASYNNGTYQHTGIVRNHLNNYWTFFDGVVQEPTTVIDWANAVYPTVKVGNLVATGNISAAGNANVGNIGATTAIFTTGNITTINSGLMQNGNSNVTIAANGNVTINAVGGAILVATSTGANITGTLSASGNANVANLSTGGSITATGNITGGNLISTGSTNVATNLNIGNGTVNTTITWASVTTTSVTANQTIASFSVTGVTGVEYLVKGVDSTGSKYSVAFVHAVTDGTNVDYVTSGTAFLGASTGSLAINVVGGQLRLQVTPASSNSTVWTTQYRLI